MGKRLDYLITYNGSNHTRFFINRKILTKCSLIKKKKMYPESDTSLKKVNSDPNPTQKVYSMFSVFTHSKLFWS